MPQGAHTAPLYPGVPVHDRSKLEQLPVGRLLLGQHGSLTLPQVQRPDLHVP